MENSLSDVAQWCSEDLKHSKTGTLAALRLLNEGYTPVFIARYRREETKDMSAELLFTLHDKLLDFNKMSIIRTKRYNILVDKGLTTNDIMNDMMSCRTMRDLDDFWEIYKEKKTSKSIEISSYKLDNVITAIMNGTINYYNIPKNHKFKYKPMECLTYLISNEIIHNKNVINEIGRVLSWSWSCLVLSTLNLT
jgi:hypothetical protein